MCGHAAGPGERRSQGKAHTHQEVSTWPRRLAHPWAKWTLFKKIYLFIITTAVLGLCSCTQAFSGYGRWGPSLVAVLGLRNAVASLTVEHRPWSTGSVVVLLGLSCPRAQPMSASQTMDLTPALASRFLTTQTTREAPSGLLINGGSPGTAFGRKIKEDTPGRGKGAGGRRNR